MCNTSATTLEVKAATFQLLFWVGNPVIMIGIFTSILSFTMFTVDNFTPKTTKLMLKSMALIDSVFLICAIGYIEFKVIYLLFPDAKKGLKNFREHPYFASPLTVVINMCEMLRNWLTVLMGIERYLVTCHPLKAGKFCTKKRSIIGICSCIGLTLILRIPTIVRQATRNFPRFKEISLLAYNLHSLIDSIFLMVLPVLILTFCSVSIMKALNRSKALIRESGHCKLNSTQSKVLKVTRMLMVVLIIFTVSGIPWLLYTIMNYLPEGVLCGAHIRIVVNICWFMSMTYSTSNFFVYVIYMPKYRHILRRILTCQKHIHDTRHLDFLSMTRRPHHEDSDQGDHNEKRELLHVRLNIDHPTPTRSSHM